ncbi:MAG TPA: hypothetical protein VII24_00350 [Pseudolabrys sp.]
MLLAAVGEAGEETDPRGDPQHEQGSVLDLIGHFFKGVAPEVRRFVCDRFSDIARAFAHALHDARKRVADEIANLT